MKERRTGLLIEPYGIEIALLTFFDSSIGSLLIEPYGIEIILFKWVRLMMVTFNRTLWN